MSGIRGCDKQDLGRGKLPSRHWHVFMGPTMFSDPHPCLSTLCLHHPFQHMAFTETQSIAPHPQNHPKQALILKQKLPLCDSTSIKRIHQGQPLLQNQTSAQAESSAGRHCPPRLWLPDSHPLGRLVLPPMSPQVQLQNSLSWTGLQSSVLPTGGKSLIQMHHGSRLWPATGHSPRSGYQI